MGKHVIVGAGQIGRLLATRLVADGHEVTVVSRSGSGPDGVTKVAASAADEARLTQVAQGADVLYNCANPQYHRWTQDWPPMAAAMLGAAQTTGAVLTTLANLYPYGPVDRPMTEDLPLSSAGVKGQVRARMWADALAAHRAGRIRMTELRASDYYGPGVRDQGHAGERFFPPLLAGKPAGYLHDPTVRRSWTYVHDVAAALAAAGSDERAYGRAWHVPTVAPFSARELADKAAAIAGTSPARIRRLPYWVQDAMGLVSPMMRELKETRYQFDRPFVLDSSDFQATFGQQPTPLDEGVAATVSWWQGQPAR
ncbi:NAD-dependent epimerase/dehydratase family protein [Jiangella rhizosphaerae]|uniref:NAD-dependent epimerase/dehydratase family protein n=1 Tax=Jiangella rhizosphaerae TaxID=2293569 RepID=A0A418KLP9_9ACTN|nr:NAD-dependent epimerase/dehydratase family protein [Jiangella rhizosphaerae]RIQ18855.1 NAD-dependent epimerase/dehydratase family protein [Jiangella rhizosphaerae]